MSFHDRPREAAEHARPRDWPDLVALALELGLARRVHVREGTLFDVLSALGDEVDDWIKPRIVRLLEHWEKMGVVTRL